MIPQILLDETPQWIAVNKPAGMVVEKNPFEDSIETLVHRYVKAQQVRQAFVGVVHRLDRPTSGVLLFTKKKLALKNLNEQFRNRQVKKVYLALVDQAPPQAEGELSQWLFKDDLRKMAVVFDQEAPGRVFCQLRYRLVQQNKGYYLLEIHPTTGRFHQIRAQLAALGCPIVGDEKYGSRATYWPNCIALHSWKLSFLDPLSGEPAQLTAPPPADEWWSNFEEWTKNS